MSGVQRLRSRRGVVIGGVICLILGLIAWWGLSPDPVVESSSERPGSAAKLGGKRRGRAGLYRELVVLDRQTRTPVGRAAVRTATGQLMWSDSEGVVTWPLEEETVVVSARGYLPQRTVVSSDTDTVLLDRGGYTVSGSVRDVYGGVVAGATVRAGPLAATETGDEGEYQLTVPAGTWRVQAGSEDYFPEAHLVRVAADSSLDFDLVPGSSIEGVVVDERGAPAPDAAVEYAVFVPRANGFEHRRSSDSRRVTTDAEGRFRLGPLETGTYQLVASTRERSTVAPASVRVTSLEAIRGVRLAVLPGHTISGQVLDDESRPVPGVVVSARHRNGVRLEAATAPDGEFSIAGLHSGRWAFDVEGGTLPSSRAERVVGENPLPPLELIRPRLGRIEGLVENGGNAHLSLSAPPGPVSPADLGRRRALRNLYAETDASGGFVLNSIPPGEVRVSAIADGGRTGFADANIVPGGVARVRLELESPGQLNGTVLNRDGDLAHVRVRVRGHAELAPVACDEDGVFVIRNVPAGRWSLDVLHHGAQVPIEHGPEYVTVSRGETTYADLEISSASQSLRGTVATSSGDLVADALVEVQGGKHGETQRVVTDAEGEFAAPTASAASYRVEVTGPAGLGVAAIGDLASDATTTIVLPSLASVRGRVTSNGSPVSLFEVRTPQMSVFGLFVADNDGRFELHDLRQGPVVVTVLAQEGIGLATVELDEAASETLEIELDAWGRIHGQVLDSGGDPVRGATVDASSEAGRADTAGPATTDEDGRYSIEGLGAGVATIKARLGDAVSRPVSIAIEPGDDVELEPLRL